VSWTKRHIHLKPIHNSGSIDIGEHDNKINPVYKANYTDVTGDIGRTHMFSYILALEWDLCDNMYMGDKLAAGA